MWGLCCRTPCRSRPGPCSDPQALYRWAQLVAAHKAFAKLYEATVVADVIESNSVIESALSHIDEELLANVPLGTTS